MKRDEKQVGNENYDVQKTNVSNLRISRACIRYVHFITVIKISQFVTPVEQNNAYYQDERRTRTYFLKCVWIVG